jgi:Mor family transcriptional regulator
MNDGFFPGLTAVIFQELLARKVDETAAGEIAEQVAIQTMRRFAGMSLYIPNGGVHMIQRRNAKIVKLRTEGATQGELSQHFGLSIRRINSILEDAGLTKKRKEKKP